MNKKEKAQKILRQLKKTPSTQAIVSRSQPFKTLVSTVLSQRTRDSNTRAASEKLFSKIKSPRQLANADLRELGRLIKQSGFYKVKARRLKRMALELEKRFNGKVPRGLDELLSLPGVGRKTAQCVRIYAFGLDAIAVDTHVHRISNRLGLVGTKRPEETESALEALFSKRQWREVNNLFVKFGQSVCLPVKPRCSECPISRHCNYFSSTYT